MNSNTKSLNYSKQDVVSRIRRGAKEFNKVTTLNLYSNIKKGHISII